MLHADTTTFLFDLPFHEGLSLFGREEGPSSPGVTVRLVNGEVHEHYRGMYARTGPDGTRVAGVVRCAYSVQETGALTVLASKHFPSSGVLGTATRTVITYGPGQWLSVTGDSHEDQYAGSGHLRSAD